MSEKSLEGFERAFDDSVGGCYRQCACGVTFYNPDGGWTWEEGELEALQANKAARSLPWSVGCLTFEGVQYVPDCECWKARARKIVGFLLAHDHQIAEFLTLEKKRKQAEANASPLVEKGETPQ